MGTLEGSGREDDGLRRERTGRGLEQEAAVRARAERGGRDPFSHRRLEPRRVALEVLDELVAGHESVGVVPLVLTPGQQHAPIRRHQAEAVPAPTPGLPHATFLEHEVLDARLRQLVAHREPGLACADDDDLRHLQPHDAANAKEAQSEPTVEIGVEGARYDANRLSVTRGVVPRFTRLRPASRRVVSFRNPRRPERSSGPRAGRAP